MAAEQQSASRAFVYVILAAVAALVYMINLNGSGFSMSEGHRVVPGLEMLENHDWFMPHMFGQAYLRKPPGMPWAIAASSAVFGHTEFAARLVSTCSMYVAACVSAFFARKWFGGGAALAAGLAQLLLPWFFESGRAAEIEALNNCGTALAVWSIVDLLAAPRSSRAGTSVAICIAGVAIAALAKGPAALPVFAAVLLAACWVQRSFRPLIRPGALLAGVGVLLALICFGVLIAQRRHAEAGPIVTQGVEEFLWAKSKLLQIITLPGAFLGYAFPASLALVPALRDRTLPLEQRTYARTLALAAILSVLIFTIGGVSNPRYTLPAGAVLSPLVPFALLSWTAEAARAHGALSRVAHLLTRLARPLAVTLLLAGVAYAFISEQRRESSSGRTAGLALAGVVPDHATILANDMIEARPEVLLYALQSAARHGRTLNARWVPRLTSDIAPFAGEPDLFILVRTDDFSHELADLKASGLMARLSLTQYSASVGSGNHPFTCTLYRVRKP